MMSRQQAAQSLAESTAAKLFALPAGTRVRLTFQTDRTWEGEITKQGGIGCDLVGKRKAHRSIVRNRNTGIAYFIEMAGHRSTGDWIVMGLEVL
jgi:hypothetical protein